MENKVDSLLDRYVFMEKTKDILDISLKTELNCILFGPGGHGKSEYTLDFLYENGINPYVITMGSGMTGERLFGGINLKLLNEEGKIEYLIENSFMNHEYVIFEEMMDAPDFILEQLKDILSSGLFRNGTQVFEIKTKTIICCTNKTRSEFSSNDSLKALMERFPLELNVIWDTYNSTTYTTLLKKRFGEDKIDPIIPFILEEYAKSGIVISPRIAVIAYATYVECGPNALLYLADFQKKSEIVKQSITKFENSIKFKNRVAEIEPSMEYIRIKSKLQSLDQIRSCDDDEKLKFIKHYQTLKDFKKELSKMQVTDDLIQTFSSVSNTVSNLIFSSFDDILIDFKVELDNKGILQKNENVNVSTEKPKTTKSRKKTVETF